MNIKYIISFAMLIALTNWLIQGAAERATPNGDMRGANNGSNGSLHEAVRCGDLETVSKVISEEKSSTVYVPGKGVVDSGKVCAKCDKKSQGLMSCSRCKKVKYCSKECQKSDWKQHKKDCSKLAVGISSDESRVNQSQVQQVDQIKLIEVRQAELESVESQQPESQSVKIERSGCIKWNQYSKKQWEEIRIGKQPAKVNLQNGVSSHGLQDQHQQQLAQSQTELKLQAQQSESQLVKLGREECLKWEEMRRGKQPAKVNLQNGVSNHGLQDQHQQQLVQSQMELKLQAHEDAQIAQVMASSRRERDESIRRSDYFDASQGAAMSASLTDETSVVNMTEDEELAAALKLSMQGIDEIDGGVEGGRHQMTDQLDTTEDSLNVVGFVVENEALEHSVVATHALHVSDEPAVILKNEVVVQKLDVLQVAEQGVNNEKGQDHNKTQLADAQSQPENGSQMSDCTAPEHKKLEDFTESLRLLIQNQGQGKANSARKREIEGLLRTIDQQLQEFVVATGMVELINEIEIDGKKFFIHVIDTIKDGKENKNIFYAFWPYLKNANNKSIVATLRDYVSTLLKQKANSDNQALRTIGMTLGCQVPVSEISREGNIALSQEQLVDTNAVHAASKQMSSGEGEEANRHRGFFICDQSGKVVPASAEEIAKASCQASRIELEINGAKMIFKNCPQQKVVSQPEGERLSVENEVPDFSVPVWPLQEARPTPDVSELSPANDVIESSVDGSRNIKETGDGMQNTSIVSGITPAFAAAATQSVKSPKSARIRRRKMTKNQIIALAGDTCKSVELIALAGDTCKSVECKLCSKDIQHCSFTEDEGSEILQCCGNFGHSTFAAEVIKKYPSLIACVNDELGWRWLKRYRAPSTIKASERAPYYGEQVKAHYYGQLSLKRVEEKNAVRGKGLSNALAVGQKVSNERRYSF